MSIDAAQAVKLTKKRTIPMLDKTACGECGSTSLNDLGHGKNGSVICLNCQAKWWERWRTKKEHEDYINKPNKPPADNTEKTT